MEEDKASFLGSDKRLNAYHNLIDLLINLNKEKGDQRYLTQAFSFIERAKSRAFLDSIESSNLEKEIPADPKLINQEKEIMKRYVETLYQINRLLTCQKTKEQLSCKKLKASKTNSIILKGRSALRILLMLI